MKKLFKEVWKSFSKSKVILVGLIILIFLTSGIITLVLDVYNSYNSKYETYKSKSVLQDITMNTSLNLYGSYPNKFYKGPQPEQLKYKNGNYLVEDPYKEAWIHKENKNNYIDYIQINNQDDFIKIDNTFIPSLGQGISFFVKTKDLSDLLNTNLNIGQIVNSTGSESVKITLNPTGNNLITYYKEGPNGDKVEVKDEEITTINGIHDTYDLNTNSWSISSNPAKLYKKQLLGGTFKELLFDKETKKMYLKETILNNKSSAEYAKYQASKNSFIELSGEKVGNLLGFKELKLDNTGTWILDANIKNYQNGMSANSFFNSSSLPQIKSQFDLLQPIVISNKFDIKEFIIPSRWFVYSQYSYIFTKKTFELDIASNEWSGYYKDFLNELSLQDKEKYSKTSYWEKEVLIEKVDYQGNPIQFIDENNQIIDNSNISNSFKKVILTLNDLNLEIRSVKEPQGNPTTISRLENLPNVSEKDLTRLTTNNESLFTEEIKNKAKEWKEQQIYKEFQKITSKLGIRETLTVNSNTPDNSTNVYQFINLGNSKGELNWNNISIKQEVGKLVNTSLDNPIYNLPSNINSESKKVPIEYMPSILDNLLTGLSLNREYINPMISFNSFEYGVDSNNVPLIAKTAKIVWTTINGEKHLNDIYGISTIRDKKNGTKTYYILKTSLEQPLISWKLEKSFTNFKDFASYIIQTNLNFAPFDLYGNDLKVVGEKGWARQDSQFRDKYSIPFNYLLPSADIIKSYNDAKNNPNSGKFGMEIFRDNLIQTLTLEIRPLIPASIWFKLMNGINTAFSNYGFGEGLTPPAALSVQTLIKVALGVIRDSVVNSNEAFARPFFANIFDGIKRSFNPNGTTPIDEQILYLRQQLSNISKILTLTLGSGFNLVRFVDYITNPTDFIDGFKNLFASIDIDKAIVDLWNSFYGPNGENEKPNKTMGTGDFLPAIYKNVYSFDVLKASIQKILGATTIGNKKAFELLKQLVNAGVIQIPPSILPIINLILGNQTVSELVNSINFVEPQEGYNQLVAATKVEQYQYQGKTFEAKTIALQDILKLITIKNINLGTVVPNAQTTIPYDPSESIPLELDMDTMWYFDNYVFTNNPISKVDDQSNRMKLFGINPMFFIGYATSAFTEVKDDYNIITMTEDAGKIAIVNSAFLSQNNKEVYKGNISEAIGNIADIGDKYKINVNGVEYIIIGSDFSVDYMYPVINSQNVTVNTKTQALVYVNQYGFDRMKRSYPNSPYEKYFLMTAAKGMSAKELQTKLNEYIYLLATGNEYTGNDVNGKDNKYKLAYLATESSLLNPERSLRLTVIDDMLFNLENSRNLIGIILIVITSIVIMFVVRRYIGSRSKVLGILKAQGYSSIEIAGAICLFPLFVSIIGATLGYICGLIAQLGMYKLFSIFWTMPIATIPFNFVTFFVTLTVPIILLCGLTVITTIWFLQKNKALAMMNGSMEVNKSIFAGSVKKAVAKTNIKNKFSVSLALGSIGKLIALFISALFTASVTLFAVTSYKTFDKSIASSYKDKKYQYNVSFLSPTYEGGEVQTYYINPTASSDIDIANMLYVPVGDPSEGYVYYSNYFKPGYNEIINKNGANGNLATTDTTTPHIFTKASVDLTVNAGGLTINVWKNLYNAIPESQRASIISSSSKSNQWLEWTQEGNRYLYNGHEYITKFMNFNKPDEYLTLWDPTTNKNLQINVVAQDGSSSMQDIRIDYFNYVEEDNIENSKFIYRKSLLLNKPAIIASNNFYQEKELQITGEDESNKERKMYRDFLVNGYQKMFAYDEANKENLSLIPLDQRSEMPEYSLDYFISPGAILLGYDKDLKINDDTFTYIDAKNININENIQPKIMGYKEDSKYVKVVDGSGNNLINLANEKANELLQNNEYPLIINKVVSEKYGLGVGSSLVFNVSNRYDRNFNKLKAAIKEINNDDQIIIDNPENNFNFKVIGISNTYINEEWITSKKIANKIIGLSENAFNGSLTNLEAPVPLANSLPLYAANGYWSADNKIFTSNNINNLSSSELKRIIQTYREIFYKPSINNENESLVATWIKEINKSYTNENVNNLIKELVELTNIDIQYKENNNEANIASASLANKAIGTFIEIYKDDALAAILENAVSNGVEKEYIEKASKTVNDTLTIMIGITFAISLTVLVMITSMIINENERNIAIFGIMGYTTKEKLMMFFSIYVPIVIISLLLSILIVWLAIPIFLSTILQTTSILLPMGMSFVSILIASGIITFIFAVTCMISWFVQGRIQPIILLKGV